MFIVSTVGKVFFPHLLGLEIHGQEEKPFSTICVKTFKCYILFCPRLVVCNYTLRKSLGVNKNFADSENCDETGLRINYNLPLR